MRGLHVLFRVEVWQQTMLVAVASEPALETLKYS